MNVMEEAEVMALCSNNNESNSSSSNNTANNNDQQCAHAVVKGKRTKRQRLQPFLAAATTTASTSSNSSDVEVSSSTTEEDEDMANCLILLARGRAAPDAAVPQPTSSAEEEAIAPVNRPLTEKFTSRRFNEAATTTEGKAGFFAYECKTCNKCFPSFQALGGHRASHKKPKIAAPAEEKKSSMELVDEDSLQIGMNSFSKAIVAPNSNTSISVGNTKPRVHECSICGSEFSSGQALGGHMRRHRQLTVAESPEMKKERNILSLDLNLPAPSDDGHGEFAKPPSTGAAFQFESKRPLVFSASALVGCHY